MLFLTGNSYDLQIRVSEEKGIKANSGSFLMKHNFIYPPVNYCTYLLSPIQPGCHVPMWASVYPYKQTLWTCCHLPMWPFSVWISCERRCSQWGCGNSLGGGFSHLEAGGWQLWEGAAQRHIPSSWDFTGVWAGDQDDSSHIFRRCLCNGTSAVSIINSINFKKPRQAALLGSLAA